LEIKFIGTGSGKTSTKRFHSSFIIKSKDYNLLVDTGDGISKALLSQNISYNSIDGILISHLHPDHFSGLSALIIQMKITARKNSLDIFIHETLAKTVKNIIYMSYIFKEKMDFTINYIPFENDTSCIVTNGLVFIAKQNTHLDQYKIYDDLDMLSFSCSSFLFTLNEINIHYTGDIGKPDDLILFKDYHIHTFISEISHIDLPDLLKTAELLEVKKLVLTHISDEDEPVLSKLKSLSVSDYSFDLIEAYDGLAISM
jgi:ribonuclease Z